MRDPLLAAIKRSLGHAGATNTTHRPVASDRYHYDARFHALVDSIASVLSDGRFTPDELRAALTLAISISEGHRVPYCGVPR